MSLLRRPSAFIPLAMSLAALGIVGLHVAIHGTAAEPDEGTAAHLWQLLMAGQLPVIAFFAAAWLPRQPAKAAGVLALQVLGAAAAMVPIFLLHW